MTPTLTVRLLAAESPRSPGFSLGGEYLETVCSSFLGPTAVLLARAFHRRLDEGGEAEVDLREIAVEIGVRASSDRPMGNKSPLLRAMERLEHHGFLRLEASGVIVVSVTHGPVSANDLARLPDRARAAHDRLVSALSTSPPA